MIYGTSSEKSIHFSDSDTTETMNGRGVVPISTYREDKPNIMPYVNLILGILLGIAVTCILIVPSAKKNIRAEYDREQLDFSSESECTISEYLKT